jgi:ferrous iron transport protein B
MNSKTIYLVGNPNCGKTTLFNQLTGLRQKTGNFSGVTVEQKSGTIISENGPITIIDLPGTHGMGGKTEDRRITYEILLQRKAEDEILYVLDALNLERGLQFLLQVMDMGAPVSVVITMKDVLEKKNISLDLNVLQAKLGLNIFLINAKSGEGIDTLKNALQDSKNSRSVGRLWVWDKREEEELRRIKNICNVTDTKAEFFLNQSLKYLSRDPSQEDPQYLNVFPEETILWLRREFLSSKFQFSYQEEIIHKSFFIKQLLAKVLQVGGNANREYDTKIDAILIHPVWGFVFFLSLMILLFQTLFSWAELPMQAIEETVIFTQGFLTESLPEGLFRQLLVDGVLGGVGSVIAFVPQIALLFLFLGLLEESGYLARASFLMDRTMGKFGLSGKSFIPLLSSAACAVPAIMGTRTIENRADRITTIMISPLIMCSARYPVYILVVGTVFNIPPLFGFINIQGLVLFCMFLLGLLTSLTIGLLFRKTVFMEESSYFIMELPRYMVPSFKSLLHTVMHKVSTFLQTAGQIIMYISIILWFLSTFPANYQNEKWETSKIEDSYIGQTGKFIEPALLPMGFDWKIGISMITSFAAREVMVSTLAVLYGSSEGEESEPLRKQLRSEKKKDGSPLWSPLTGLSLLVFFAYASQCMSTLAVVRKETQSFFWPMVQFAYMTGLALASSTLIYQIGKALGFS